MAILRLLLQTHLMCRSLVVIKAVGAIATHSQWKACWASATEHGPATTQWGACGELASDYGACHGLRFRGGCLAVCVRGLCPPCAASVACRVRWRPPTRCHAVGSCCLLCGLGSLCDSLSVSSQHALVPGVRAGPSSQEAEAPGPAGPPEERVSSCRHGSVV